jgi:ferredoxin
MARAPAKSRDRLVKAEAAAVPERRPAEEDETDRLAYFDFARPAELRIGCGACTQVCPADAIHIKEHDGMRSTIITGTVVREQPLLSCSQCGAPTATPAHRDFIRDRLPDHRTATLDRELCPSCAPAGPSSRSLRKQPSALKPSARRPHHPAARTCSIHAIAAIAVGKPAVEMASSAL